MLGIFIGIAAVVSLISLSDGLRGAITGQFGSLGSDKLTIQNAGTGFGPPGSTSVAKLNNHDIDIIEKVNGVNIVVPRLIRMVKVEYNDVVQFKYAGSIPDDKQQVKMVIDSMNIKMQEGMMLEAGETGKVVLGNDFTKTADFGKGLRENVKINIQGKDFRVKGIMQKQSSLITNGVIIMSEKDMKDILNISDETDLIVVQIKSGEDIEKVAADIKEAMRKDRNENIGEEDFSVQTPVQSLQAVDTILTIINIIIIGIASISLLVGGIGIANTMYTSVLERRKEIGVMNSDILWIFLIEAGLLGLAGGIIGAVIGLGAAMLIAMVAKGFLGGVAFDVVISWPLLIFAVAFAFILGAISGVTPALQASKLRPVDALRS